MATKEAWVEKIRSWTPSWFHNADDLTDAVIHALAATFAASEIDIEDSVSQTYIEFAIGGVLGIHGSERGVVKLPLETEQEFRKRIRASAVISNANIPALLGIVNKVLNNGVAQIREDYNTKFFLNRGAFCRRAVVITIPVHNSFTILIENQFEPKEQVFELIVKVINDNKAFGCMYRVIERLA